MRAGALEANGLFIHKIDQQPIGLDVKIAPWLPLAFQWVIAQLAGQGLACQQQADHMAQFVDISATFFLPV